ncbi:MAG: DNA polymerase [Candidatus Paceibacterota bacterium]
MTDKKHQEKLVILDAHAIIHRAYHALPDFTSSTGEPTGGLYGLSAMLIRLISELKPGYLVAAYDLPEPTFRKQAYDGYKAGRQKADDDLISQIERSRDIFTAFNIPIFEAPGFEADDIIGTIVEQTKTEKDLQVIIASGDMDTLQLTAGDRVVVYTFKQGIKDTIIYNEAKVKERFGFRPGLLVDYKGLRGDPSDNIIGISGIGEKTATLLISHFGSIEAIYRQLNKDEKPLLAAGLKPRILNLLKDNKEEAFFSKELATIRRDAPIVFRRPSDKWQTGFSLSVVAELFKSLNFRSLSDRLKVISPTDSEVLEEKTTSSSARRGIDEQSVKRVGLALWLIDSDQTTPTLDDILDFTGQSSFTEAEKIIMAELKKQKLTKIYEEIELPIIPIIDQAKERGVLLNTRHLKKLSIKHHRRLNELAKDIYRLAGREFNLNSPKQLAEVLFTEMKLTVGGLKKTAGGGRSTRESELAKLKDKHPIINLILAYREIQKILSTYVDNLPALVDKDNRLHANFNQAGTTTGRMSSNNPNLQNIPIRGELGEDIRRAFIATPGHRWIAADYSQIEMRVLAILSGDESLLNIFREGRDVHAGVASLVFGVPEAEVTKDMRRRAKVINFGIIYGMGVNALRVNLGTGREEAQKFYDDFFKTFPTIRHYFDQVISDAYTKGYTETLFGRRRYFSGLKSRLPYVRAQAERMAMNAPIQGTATGDIVKLAMKNTDTALKEAGLADHSHFLMQIHDELIYEVLAEHQDRVAGIIKQSMEQAIKTDIPLIVDISIGENWGELKSF